MILNKNAIQQGFNIIRSGSDCSITLYEGLQPSMTEFVANFSTNYNQSGVNTLQTYNINTFFDEQYLSSSSTRFVKRTGPDISFSKQSIRSGTASWAVIFFQSSSMPSTITNDSKFIIVPVSNLSGLGILKLRSTTVTYSSSTEDNLIADFILDISSSFSVTGGGSDSAADGSTTDAGVGDSVPGVDSSSVDSSTTDGGASGVDSASDASGTNPADGSYAGGDGGGADGSTDGGM